MQTKIAETTTNLRGHAGNAHCQQKDTSFTDNERLGPRLASIYTVYCISQSPKHIGPKAISLQ